MEQAGLRELRLRVQGLRAPFDASAPEVVRRFAAVQAQEFLPAQWGLAVRVPTERRPDAATVAAALDAGEILRTHVLRPTWHFLHPDDARWIMEVSAERVYGASRTYLRRVGLEEGDTAKRGLALVAGSLEGGHRTRAELSAALEAGGLPLTGLAFTYLIMLAELERVAISGTNAGRQRTYAAFDERVPPSAPRPREEAIAELAARFIASRGPVTERDFAAWSGFTLGDARAAFADASDAAGRGDGRIERIDVDGTPHVLDAASVASLEPADPATDGVGRDVVDLLQAYDEYIMGYAPPRSYLQPPGRSDPVRPEFPLHALAVDGIMAGRWAPVVEAKRARVRIVPWRELSRAEERSLAASVAEVERFLGMPVTVEHEPIPAG